MIIILGLVVLIAAVVIAWPASRQPRRRHDLVHPFAVFGYHVTGSNGRLFLYGIVVGVIGVAGLSLLLAGAAHLARPPRPAAVPPGDGHCQPGPRPPPRPARERPRVHGKRSERRHAPASPIPAPTTAAEAGCSGTGSLPSRAHPMSPSTRPHRSATDERQQPYECGRAASPSRRDSGSPRTGQGDAHAGRPCPGIVTAVCVHVQSAGTGRPPACAARQTGQARTAKGAIRRRFRQLRSEMRRADGNRSA